MNTKALYNISYGLFVVSANAWERDSGCICNTFIQVTSEPLSASVTLNNNNFTTYMIKQSGEFNISVLSEKAPFSLFQNFGFQSGKDVDKLKNARYERSKNGLFYLTDGANSYFSCKVKETINLGSHTMFIADIFDAEVTSSDPSATYSYYHKSIKPAPAKAVKGYQCQICNHIHPEDEFPPDYLCPICGHGPEFFKKL